MPTVQELAAALAAEVRGDPNLAIRDGGSLDRAGPDEITFAGDKANLKKLPQSRAGAVIVSRSLIEELPELPRAVTLLLVDDATAGFIQALHILRPERSRPEWGVTPQAFVSQSARIGAETNIFPGASVAESVTIGARCDIHSGVQIGPGCRIGDDVTLFPNVVLYPDVVVGDRVRIHASSVIGADGFGYRLIDGRHVKIPHFGGVRIGADVEIGASTTIDRGMIGQTVIGEGTKIDNQVMIAHNCELGRHNIIVSQVGFAGSASSGDYVVIAGQAGVSDHVHLGESSVIGSRSAVKKDVPNGATYLGVPAVPLSVAMKQATAQKKVPEMRTALRRMESQFEQLSARIDALDESAASTSQPAA